MVRIVHTADMHFDSPFAALPASVARLRKEEQKGTFCRILDFVRENNADILLIAGDMFDSRYVSSDTIAFLQNGFAQIPDAKVFITPGNHDFLSSDSPYRTVNFGENVHVFNGDFEKVEVKDADIYGCGFSSRFVQNTLLPGSFRHTGNNPGILLMHGDIGTDSDYNPIAESSLSASGLSYAALGHVHSYTGICNAGDTKYAYCGIPEGRHFDEDGVCGFIYGEISADKTELSFIPSAKRQNITLEIDISDFSSIEGVLHKIRENLYSENLYKIVLSGDVPDSLYVDTSILQKELSDACLYIKIKDSTKTNSTGTEESFLEKLFVEKLRERNDEIGLLAIKFGIEALRRKRQ